MRRLLLTASIMITLATGLVTYVVTLEENMMPEEQLIQQLNTQTNGSSSSIDSNQFSKTDSLVNEKLQDK